MGYNEKGHCPMFKNNACSIYEHRPQTCRTYDCRIFPATGLTLGEDKPLISEQANRWEFALTTIEDGKQITAVKLAAKFLNKFLEYFPAGFVPVNVTQQAVMAIEVYEVFLDLDFKFGKGEDKDLIRKIAEKVIVGYEVKK